MNKHTPGPWEIEERGSHSNQIVVIHELETPTGEPTWVEVWSPARRYEHQPANARLIRAAPDMLDVLKTIENDESQVPEWLWDRIQAVIEKAEGGTT